MQGWIFPLRKIMSNISAFQNFSFIALGKTFLFRFKFFAGKYFSEKKFSFVMYVSISYCDYIESCSEVYFEQNDLKYFRIVSTTFAIKEGMHL